MKMTLRQIKKGALPVLKKAGVTRSAIFGSYVRGEANVKSDIDILIELPKGKSLLDFVDLKLKLEKALKRKVDLGEYGTIKPLLKDTILSEQIRIL